MEEKLKKIKGIVFDLDGLLLDTEYYQWQGWVPFLRNHGIELTKEKYLNYAGKRGDIIEDEMVKDFNLNIKKGELINAKEEYLKERLKNEKISLMPYAREIVEFFYYNPNYDISVCAGAPREETLIKLKNCDFLKYFKTIVCGDEIKRGKPNPDMYLRVAEVMGLKPEECLAFEDTQYGTMSAKSAGMMCFSVPNEYCTKQEYSMSDKVLNSLNDTFQYFNHE